MVDDPADVPTSRLDPWDFRTFLALLMATIATFGAIAAFRAAVRDGDVAAATRLYDEGQILELDKRQRYLDETGLSGSYGQNAAALREAARTLNRNTNTRLAGQEDLAVARIADRYTNYYNWDLDGYSTEGEFERWAVIDLGEMGFNVSWTPSDNQGPHAPDSWPNQRTDIADLGWQLRMMTAAVVLFVLALLCLTVADLITSSGRKRWIIAGAALTVLALAIMLFPLHGTGTVILAIVAFVVVGLLTARLLSMAATTNRDPEQLEFLPPPATDGNTGPLSTFPGRAQSWFRAIMTPGVKGEDHDTTAAELEPTGYIGSRIISRETHGAFSQSVVLAIALTALLSAFCGFLYSYSAEKMNESSSEAVADQATEFRESTRARLVANNLVGAVMRLQEDEARYDTAAQAAQLVNEGMLRAPAAAIELEKTVRGAIYDDDLKKFKQTFGLGFFSDNTEPSSVVSDATFPSRLINDRASAGSDRAFAMWDADN